MSKLLRAGTRRYLRSPIWWLSVIVSIIFGLCFGDMVYKNYRFEASYYIIPQIIFSVLISLSISKEFSDGTVRNKIISGCTKQAVFFSEIILGVSACLILFLIYLITLSTFCIPALSMIPTDIGINSFFGFMLSVVSTSVICVLIAVLITKKVTAAVISIIFILAITYVSSEINLALGRPEYTRSVEFVYNEETEKSEVVIGELVPNPQYVGGTKRKLYIFISDILPSGQAEEYNEILNIYMHRGDTPRIISSEQSLALKTHHIFSLGVIAVLFSTGCLIFCRRDMK